MATHHPTQTPFKPLRNVAPSSSPAFGTPVHPFIPPRLKPQANPAILPVMLPGPTLRPLAFRAFKKYSLTLSSSALQTLASFIGSKCGAGWREDGLAEKVLEEIARAWKKRGGGVIVENGPVLADLLKTLESCIVGGKITQGALSRQGSFSINQAENGSPGGPQLLRTESVGSSAVDKLELDGDDATGDLWKWTKVIGAFDQPRLVYNAAKKHFDRNNTAPSLFPPPSHRTHLFRHRYHVIHQRLLRHESFQQPTVAPVQAGLQRSASSLATVQQNYKITPIANLLGRDGSSHLLLGLLTISPTGTLQLADLTGSIALDLTHARAIPEDGVWFAPGMIVLVDGIYECDSSNSSQLSGAGGVGGAVGGRFVGLSLGGPPCEKREVTLGVSGKDDVIAGGGFGWVDFLGVGSERAVGQRMRRLQTKVLTPTPVGVLEDLDRAKMVVLGDVALDQPASLAALKAVLTQYSLAAVAPAIFVLTGSFLSLPKFASGSREAGSVEYKEIFDALASVLSDFPSLLQRSKWIFVPGDNDGWESSFSAGSGTVIPRQPVPELFTSRVKRAFTSANAEVSGPVGGADEKGEAIWTSNPSRLSLFGPVNEVVIFRDDMGARFRRNAVTLKRSKEPAAMDEEADEIMSDPVHTGQEAADSSHTDITMDVDSQVQRAESVLPMPSSPPSSSLPQQSQSKTQSNSQTQQRSAALSAQTKAARKLVKTVLDQGHLSPFPLTTRPILWDYDNALSLYPLPSLLILSDATSPAFALTYCGCSVVNPGTIVGIGSSDSGLSKRRVARWCEVGIASSGLKGEVRQIPF